MTDWESTQAALKQAAAALLTGNTTRLEGKIVMTVKSTSKKKGTHIQKYLNGFSTSMKKDAKQCISKPVLAEAKKHF